MKSEHAWRAAATGKAAPLAKGLGPRNGRRPDRFPLHSGTKVKALFTISPAKHYAFEMLFLLAAAAAVATPQPEPMFRHAAVSAQAQAVVRIVSGVRLRLGEGAVGGAAPAVTDAMVHAEGDVRPARLIEFQ